ncbi:MAG: Na+/H+ antiporter subunit E [Aquificaceae bacterium]|jgi:multicomponent Na+:H+ antiporter subunit E|uniref:Na+/H+ antiporter subunit E n=1 Tax=Hydrogenobacter sp. Uz 6-8 TaxID=3384828 RepID=UPI0030B020E5
MFILALFYSLLWLLISGVEAKSLFFGSISLFTALLFHKLLRVYLPRLNFFALLSFFITFLGQSFLSGIDVTRRVIGPRLLVNPGFVTYNLTTHKQPARFLLCMVINLTPGTLSVELSGDRILIHTLDIKDFSEEKLRELERLVDRVFS